MTSPLDIVRHWWDFYRERPFLRLVRIFVERIFRGGGDADAEGVDLGVGLVLTLLAMPGGFVSVLTFVKYSTLLSWMRGTAGIDRLAIAMPEEYFFIALSMTVAGSVAAWRWDALFPDRRDYMNLVPLPISTSLIFSANLVAILFLAVLIAFDVNAASAILFPLGVGATQSSFVFFAKFALVHALVVALASIFSFFAVLAVLGLLLTILPPRSFRRISPYIRALVVMYLVTLLSTSFAAPEIMQRPDVSHSWLNWLPSCWFVGLCQALHGHADASLSSLAHLALPGLVLTIVFAFCVYALGYRRYFLRIPEMAEASPSERSSQTRATGAWFERVVLRTPFQRGCFPFVWRTLFRSEPQRLALAGISGLGIALASQSLATASQAHPARDSAPSAAALAPPLILAFFVIVGLRAVFEIPADLRSNWTFRFTLDGEHHECRALARKVILTCVLPCIVMIGLPLYAYEYGWLIGILHTLVVAAWSVLLTNAVLIHFRKLPFTCPMPVFQQYSIVTLIGGASAFFLFAIATPQAESLALAEPLWMASFIPVAALFWYIPRRMERDSLEQELVFEEKPPHAVEVLHLVD
jgi:hypothetical protein